jgi:hypothetical protein
MTDRNTAIATRLIPAPCGGFTRVPAHVAAPPRKRGALTDWLEQQRVSKGSR